MGDRTKVVSQQRIIAVTPVKCEDCGHIEKDYHKAVLEGTGGERIICHDCLLNSGKYVYDVSFLIIGKIDDIKVTKDANGNEKTRKLPYLSDDLFYEYILN